MTAVDLLEDLRQRGVTVEADRNQLRASPRRTLSNDDILALREHKDTLLALLAAPPVPAVDPNVINVINAVSPGPRCAWPGCSEPVRLVQLHDGREEPQCGYAHPQFWEPVMPTQDTAARYPCTITWATTWGYLAIRDPFTGEFHEVRKEDAPASWQDAARLARQMRPSGPTGYGRALPVVEARIATPQPADQAEDRRYPLAAATVLAEHLLARLAPACERIAIAGSLRRRKTTVKDIELVAIPKQVPADDLFGDVTKSALDDLLAVEIAAGRLARNLQHKGDGARAKYLWLPDGDLAVDLFLADADNWGNILAIRTGDGGFTKRLVTSTRLGGCMPDGMRQSEG